LLRMTVEGSKMTGVILSGAKNLHIGWVNRILCASVEPEIFFNAVTRPISGHVVNKFGHRGLSYTGLPLQSVILMLIPLFTGFGTILAVYVLSGFMRAFVIVANAVGLVQDVPESRVRRGLTSGIYNTAGDLETS